jgi:hypothetical protein
LIAFLSISPVSLKAERSKKVGSVTNAVWTLSDTRSSPVTPAKRAAVILWSGWDEKKKIKGRTLTPSSVFRDATFKIIDHVTTSWGG